MPKVNRKRLKRERERAKRDRTGLVHQQQSSRIIIMCPHYDSRFIYLHNIWKISTNLST